eukprot:gene11314-13832_t
MFFASIDFARIVREAGLLIYPLGLCSVIATFIIIERWYALRQSAVIPEHLSEAVIEGRASAGDRRSSLGRILEFAANHTGDQEATKAYARLEVIKMERGISYLDTIYAAAPLIAKWRELEAAQRGSAGASEAAASAMASAAESEADTT